MQEGFFEEAHLLRERELDLKVKLSGVAAAAPVVPIVGVAEIEHIVSTWTRIPVDRLSQADSERLMRLQDVLMVRGGSRSRVQGYGCWGRGTSSKCSSQDFCYLLR